MYAVVLATIKDGKGQARQERSDAFGCYLGDQDRHPGVTLCHGGPTLADGGETANGLMLVVEALSLEAARAFIAGTPTARPISSPSARYGPGTGRRVARGSPRIVDFDANRSPVGAEQRGLGS